MFCAWTSSWYRKQIGHKYNLRKDPFFVNGYYSFIPYKPYLFILDKCGIYLPLVCSILTWTLLTQRLSLKQRAIEMLDEWLKMTGTVRTISVGFNESLLDNLQQLTDEQIKLKIRWSNSSLTESSIDLSTLQEHVEKFDQTRLSIEERIQQFEESIQRSDNHQALLETRIQQYESERDLLDEIANSSKVIILNSRNLLPNILIITIKQMNQLIWLSSLTLQVKELDSLINPTLSEFITRVNEMETIVDREKFMEERKELIQTLKY